MPIGILILYIHIPGCASLKEKRSNIKPIIARLHREFNISTAEYGRQDAWQEAELACVSISNETVPIQQVMQQVVKFFEAHWPDVQLTNTHLEMIP